MTLPDGSLEETIKPAKPEEFGFMQPALGVLGVH